VSPESEPVMPQLNLFVGGMSCRRCVREVTARLRDVPGVETVSANPGDCLVRLSGSMQLADVLTAFEGTSYRPEVQRDQRDQDGNSGGTAAGQPPP
jgi:copper chaperone CopZ